MVIRSSYCWFVTAIENIHNVYDRTTFSALPWQWNITHSCTEHLWEVFKRPDVVTDVDSCKLTLSAELPRGKHHTALNHTCCWADWVVACAVMAYSISGVRTVYVLVILTDAHGRVLCCKADPLHCVTEHAMQLQCTTALVNMFNHT